MDRNVKLTYCNSSALDGSVLILTCVNETSTTTDEKVLNVTCHSNGNWIPNPAEFTCSSFAPTQPGIFYGPLISKELLADYLYYCYHYFIFTNSLCY